MTIVLFSEETQASLLESFNRDKERQDIVPLAPRNLNSGWPLLQVSLFSMIEGDSELYEPALGGGKCHHISISGFNLACLLTKIPGSMEITVPYRRSTKEKRKEQLRMECIQKFLHEYTVRHRHIGMLIESKSNGYGPEFRIQLPELDAKKLQWAVINAFSFALKDDRKRDVLSLAGWVEVQYTEDDVRSALNDAVAIFENGQIFLDFGALLEQQVAEPEITEYFRAIFKVDQFLTLTAAYRESASEKKTAHRAFKYEALDLPNSSEIKNLRQAISKMSGFGLKLSKAHDEKGSAANDLASELDQKINVFLKECSGKEQYLPSLFSQFNKDFKLVLHRNDEFFSEYKASYPTILTNINIALSEIEILFGHEKKLPPPLFFNKKKETRSDAAPIVKQVTFR